VFAEGEQALVVSDQETPWEGAARIYIRLSPGGPDRRIRQGTWIIRLRALKVVAREAEKGVRFDAWIERTIPDPGDTRWHLWSRFADYDRDAAITLTTPGTSHRAITVASCGLGDGAPASEFSSCGPTRDGRRKPEVAAPGEGITSSAARQSGESGNGSRTSKYGTSMSAPHVTGVVARLLTRHNYLRVDEIRTLLVNTATPPGRRQAWDRSLGYGKVNAAAAMKALENKLAQ
jgi:subtilisin family serine protease